MGTKIEEMDTLKVLAKKISPGQEHLDLYYETYGREEYFADTSKPNIIFAIGSKIVLDSILSVFTGGRRWGVDLSMVLWAFDTRAAADTFVATTLQKTSSISYWQLGLSRQFAAATEVPLILYFRDPTLVTENPSRDLLQVERLRAYASNLFDSVGRHAGMSVVFITEAVLEANAGFVPGGVIVLKKGEIIHYHLYARFEDAHAACLMAAVPGVGKVWHFGLKASK